MENYPFDETAVTARFAVVSDIHLGESPISKANQKFSRGLDRLYAAMNGRMDALMIAGDITDWGMPLQIQQFKAIIDAKLKPETVLVAAIGNHDVHDNMFKSGLGGQPFYEVLGKRMYDGATPEEINVGHTHRVINGLHFITFGHRDYPSGLSEEEDLDWLRRQLVKAVADTPDQPVFIATHPVLQNTIYGSNEGDYWCSNNLAGLLRDFPQVIIFSGHLHFPLNDERIIYQNGFTAIGTAATYYGSLHAELQGIRYIEIAYGYEPYDCHIISQALIVEVDKNGTARIRRFDLTHNAEIKHPWVVPSASTGRQPYAWASRCKENEAPKFPENASVKVTAFSKSRITLTFPAATDDDLVNGYEIRFTPLAGGKVRSVMTYSDFYRHAKVEDMSKTVTRTITRRDLQCDKLEAYSISVRALDSFGAFSDPIVNIPSEDAVQTPDESPVLQTLLNGTVCRKVYDFNFWEKGLKNIGGFMDSSAYIGDSDGAGSDYMIDAVPFGDDGGAAMKVTVINPEAKGGIRTINLRTFHPDNPFYTLTYPDSVSFSFFVDAAEWEGNLSIYPMIYDQDYHTDGTPAGITLFAPKPSFTYQIEENGKLIDCKGQGGMCLPEKYVGRVYLPLTQEAVEPAWGTQDADGKFDGQMVNRMLFVLNSLSSKGSSFLIDDIGIHGKN